MNEQKTCLKRRSMVETSRVIRLEENLALFIAAGKLKAPYGKELTD
jgi:hypothetical protein